MDPFISSSHFLPNYNFLKNSRKYARSILNQLFRGPFKSLPSLWKKASFSYTPLNLMIIILWITNCLDWSVASPRHQKISINVGITSSFGDRGGFLIIEYMKYPSQFGKLDKGWCRRILATWYNPGVYLVNKIYEYSTRGKFWYKI